MTESPSDWVHCSLCGGKNLPEAQSCVHCGQSLRDIADDVHEEHTKQPNLQDLASILVHSKDEVQQEEASAEELEPILPKKPLTAGEKYAAVLESIQKEKQLQQAKEQASQVNIGEESVRDWVTQLMREDEAKKARGSSTNATDSELDRYLTEKTMQELRDQVLVGSLTDGEEDAGTTEDPLSERLLSESQADALENSVASDLTGIVEPEKNPARLVSHNIPEDDDDAWSSLSTPQNSQLSLEVPAVLAQQEASAVQQTEPIPSSVSFADERDADDLNKDELQEASQLFSSANVENEKDERDAEDLNEDEPQEASQLFSSENAENEKDESDAEVLNEDELQEAPQLSSSANAENEEDERDADDLNEDEPQEASQLFSSENAENEKDERDADDLNDDEPQENPQLFSSENAENEEDESDVDDLNEDEPQEGPQLFSSENSENEEDEEDPAREFSPEVDLLLQKRWRERAKQLSELLNNEGKSFELRRGVSPHQAGLARIVVPLILFVVVLFCLFLNPTEAPKALPVASAASFETSLQALRSGQQVLLVIDYQAGSSAELEPLAGDVLRQLNEKQSKLRFISSRPNGLWLSRQLIERSGLSADLTAQYLPGGPLALIASAAGKSTSAEFDYLSVPNLQDFAMIILIGDSFEGQQAWIEQIEPWMKVTPILAISTLQNAPLLTAYYDSGQLVGLLAGFPEGQTSATQALNYRAWQAGMIVLLVLLILGMLIGAEMDNRGTSFTGGKNERS